MKIKTVKLFKHTLRKQLTKQISMSKNYSFSYKIRFSKKIKPQLITMNERTTKINQRTMRSNSGSRKDNFHFLPFFAIIFFSLNSHTNIKFSRNFSVFPTHSKQEKLKSFTHFSSFKSFSVLIELSIQQGEVKVHFCFLIISNETS